MFLFAIGAALYVHAQGNTWATASMTTPRNSHIVTALPDGRLLAVGGWDGTDALAGAELYDPGAQAWTPTAPLSVARSYHSAVLLPDGRVLVAGGWDRGGRALASAELYDPAKNAWQPAGALAAARAGHTMLLLPTGKALVIGGCTADGAALASAELYDPAKDAWAPAASLTAARCWHTATRLPDGRALVAGGRDGRNQPLASAELYDPKTDAWTPVAALSTPRQDHTATLLPAGSVLVVGGYNGRYLASAEIYDPAANAWRTAGSMSSARAYHSATLLRNGKVLVAGGASGSRPSASVELYNPQTRAWTAAAGLPAPYASHVATLLSDGKVLITGRPGSDDPTGNDGLPRPPTADGQNGRQSSTPLQPTPTPAGRTSASNVFNAMAETVAMAQATTASENFATGTETARLFGVYEASFTRSPSGNPHTLTVTVAFTPTLASGAAKTVFAFYNGLQGSLEIWKARIYVNRVGTWNWSASTGASGAFTAVEETTSGLRGMLRVSSATVTTAEKPGAPKRWYTDDGRTFLPMADTAYRFFFERPITSTGSIPSGCPPARTITETQDFVRNYVDEDVEHGINVLRVEVLGTWAYTDEEYNRGTDCTTDLSLFLSTDINGSSYDLFSGGPTITATMGTTMTFYPNLQSFKRTDEKLKLLLNEFPSMFVQMLLVPDPFYDSTWFGSTGPNTGIKPEFRQQLWRTMIARWAAFPNVFWSISNDLADTTSYSCNQALAKEVGCYWIGPGNQAGYCNGLSFSNFGNDPWRAGRPMSLGHLREEGDSSIGRPWHTYVTAYSAADLSAQQMDGVIPLASIDGALDQAHTFFYSGMITPTFNVEDRYEGLYKDGQTKEVWDNPSYFYRRLFWSYLLSGSGATYGAHPTWQGLATYSTGRYTVTYPTTVTNIPLVGLDSARYVPRVVQNARVDLAQFKPNDAAIPQSILTSEWTEFNRAQIASHGKQEILAYFPNTGGSVTTPDHLFRRRVVTNTGNASVVVNMTAFTDTNYAVSWHNPATGEEVTGTVQMVSGTVATPNLVAPFGGDAVLHISSRCQAPNFCEPMDGAPRPGILTKTWNSATWSLDPYQRVLEGPNKDNSERAAWRCAWPFDAPTDRLIGCAVRYPFPSRELASIDLYVRRNDKSAVLGAGFEAYGDPTQPITDYTPLPGIGVYFTPEGDVLSTIYEYGVWYEHEYKRGVPLETNRWYHVELRIRRITDQGDPYLVLNVLLDGVLVYTRTNIRFAQGDLFLRSALAFAVPWGSPTEIEDDSLPSAWFDELSVDPPTEIEVQGLYHSSFQQGLGGYPGNKATWFDAGGGYNGTTHLHVGANSVVKSLLRFDVSTLPANAVVDEATLQVYYAGRSNGNTLTLGAHRVLPEWIDSQANWSQRKTGVNWSVGGMGSGSDYTATAEATAVLTGAGGAWVELNVTNAAQAWVNNPANNYGLVLLQEAASGYVTYDFCSELGWSPCTAAQAPRLILRYHLVPPTPVKTSFQQGSGGYSGNQSTYFDTTYGYNNSYQLQVGATNSPKTLLKFDVSTIPAGKKVDEATLRLYYTGRSNGNALTIGAHRAQATWTDSQANWTQRQTGVNWSVAGMGSGSDYLAAADGTVDILGGGGSWVELDVSDMAQAWVANAADNKGVVVLQEAASGSVIYSFCSELGWSPCTSAQAPKLTIWYRP